MARPRTGTLIWRPTLGWCGRVTVEKDGETIRPIVALGTRDKVVARRKLARLNRGEIAVDDATAAETFAAAVKRLHQVRAGQGVKDADAEEGRLRLWAVPHLGELRVDAIETAHVNNVLDACAEAGKSKQTVVHVRQALRAYFGQLKREGTLKHNPVDGAELPRMKAETKKERVILTDAELAAYLAWEPDDERSLPGVQERQVLACVSRMFGGLRTGDLHALTWEHLDVEAFTWGIAPRQKTATPQVLEVPEMLRPTLRLWWEHHGCPEMGPVFPLRRGKDAGKQRRKQSHAGPLKRDLMRMMGLERRVERDAPTGPRSAWERVPVEAYTKRQRELFTETSYSLPVDFHSFRRAFNTALADAGVNVQIAMRLAGHTSTAAHMRYVMSRARQVPEAALPKLGGGFGSGRAETRERKRLSVGVPSGIRTRVAGVKGPQGRGITSQGPDLSCPNESAGDALQGVTGGRSDPVTKPSAETPTPIPAGEMSLDDVLAAADQALLAGDRHRARRLLATARTMTSAAAADAASEAS